jgi:hypothetical protein
MALMKFCFVSDIRMNVVDEFMCEAQGLQTETVQGFRERIVIDDAK